MPRNSAPTPEKPTLVFHDKRAWAAWLDDNHRTSAGVWLRMAKKSSGLPSVSYDEALDVALCYGWIDGTKKRDDAEYFLQKFTPRGKRSIWSKRNREKALALIERGEMKAAGLAEVERARTDGRWDAAYDGPSRMAVPDDLHAALHANRHAKAFFETLNSQNRYAILFRIHSAKRADTRAKRIREFVEMLARGETIYP
ncbi:MAG TPA: YdeI/OmpD-associated family protein [Gemmatimonadaceae bacterium]